MVSGSKSNPRLPILIVLFALVAMFIGGIVFAIIQARHIFVIPTQTVALISIQPKTAKALLSDTQIRQLPVIWQKTIATDSTWPVILGTAKDNENWNAFVLIPRWMAKNIPGERQNTLALTLASERMITGDTKPLRSTDAWAWRAGHRFAPIGFQVDLSSFFGTSPAEASDIRPITGTVDGRIISTDVSVAAQTQYQPLIAGDIAMDLGQINPTTPLGYTLLKEMKIGDLPLMRLNEKPTQFGINISASGTPLSTTVRFSDAIDHDLANTILSGVRKTNYKVTRMPSGEIISEMTPWLNENDTIPTTTETLFGSLMFDEKEVTLLGNSSTAQETQNLPSSLCGGRQIFAHLSTEAAKRILLQSFANAAFDVPSIDFAIEKNRLSICLE